MKSKIRRAENKYTSLRSILLQRKKSLKRDFRMGLTKKPMNRLKTFRDANHFGFLGINFCEQVDVGMIPLQCCKLWKSFLLVAYKAKATKTESYKNHVGLFALCLRSEDIGEIKAWFSLGNGTKRNWNDRNGSNKNGFVEKNYCIFGCLPRS